MSATQCHILKPKGGMRVQIRV